MAFAWWCEGGAGSVVLRTFADFLRTDFRGNMAPVRSRSQQSCGPRAACWSGQKIGHRGGPGYPPPAGFDESPTSRPTDLGFQLRRIWVRGSLDWTGDELPPRVVDAELGPHGLLVPSSTAGRRENDGVPARPDHLPDGGRPGRPGGTGAIPDQLFASPTPILFDGGRTLGHLEPRPARSTTTAKGPLPPHRFVAAPRQCALHSGRAGSLVCGCGRWPVRVRPLDRRGSLARSGRRRAGAPAPCPYY